MGGGVPAGPAGAGCRPAGVKADHRRWGSFRQEVMGYEVALKWEGGQVQPHRLVGREGPAPTPSKRRVQCSALPAPDCKPARWVGFASVVQLPVPMGLGPVLQHPRIPPRSRRLMRSRALQSRAWATWGADQPASVFSKIRARVVTRAVLLPARTKCSSWFRCSGVDSVFFPGYHHLKPFSQSGSLLVNLSQTIKSSLTDY